MLTKRDWPIRFTWIDIVCPHFTPPVSNWTAVVFYIFVNIISSLPAAYDVADGVPESNVHFLHIALLLYWCQFVTSSDNSATSGGSFMKAYFILSMFGQQIAD